MTTHAVIASSTNEPARAPAMVRAADATLLTLTELDAATGGGGPAGVNPSRNGVRPAREGI